MKKLIFFAYDLNVGGIEKALIELLKNIDLQKYNITLVLEKKDGQLLTEVPKNIKIIEYKVSNNKNKLLRKIFNLGKRISFILKHYHRYDFSCSYATYSIPGAVLSKIASKNSNLYVHSAYEYALNNKEEYYNFFHKLKIFGFNHIIFVSNESRYYFNNCFPKLKNKTLTCNNFIDENKILAMSCEKINIDKNCDVLFVFVGRLDESSKKITRLINLIKYLKDKGIGIKLWIVGDGPDRNLYEKRVKEYKLDDDIIFMGMKKNPYPFIKVADYIILTSDYEGFPMVYNEAIVLKTKVITTMNVTDDYISIPNNFGYIISKDQNAMNKEVYNILKNDKISIKNISFDSINLKKMQMLEKLFDDNV